MNSGSNSRPGSGSQKRSSPATGKRSAASVFGLLLVLAYWFVQPIVNEKWGWTLPEIGSPTAQKSTLPPDSKPAAADPDNFDQVGEQASDRKWTSAEPDPPSEPDAGKPNTPGNSSTPRNSNNPGESDTVSKPDSTGGPELRYGLLREVSAERFESPSGLLYTPGSEEGHRLRHLERHLEDMPDRPGSHGVFDGDMAQALATIDAAYELVKSKKSAVQTEENGTRSIHTVNMGRRIGYVGGREGNRRNRPMSRRLRLVVEGNRVITAFPI